MWRQIFAGGALWVSIYATFVLNFCDFTRGSKTRRSIVRGNFWGISGQHAVLRRIVVVPGRRTVQDRRPGHRQPRRHRPGDPQHRSCWCSLPGAADPDRRGEPDGQLRRPDLRADQPVPQEAELPPRRPGQRRHRPGHPAVEPVQQPGGHRLLPRRPRCPARPAVRRHHGRLLAGAPRPRSTCRRCTPKIRTGAYYYRGGVNLRASRRSSLPPRSSLLIAFVPALHAGVPVLLVHRRRHSAQHLLRRSPTAPRSFDDVSGEPIAVASVH